MKNREDAEDIIFRTVEIVAVLYFLEWFFKKMIRNPVASVIFLAMSALAVYSAYLFSPDWEFWPLLLCAIAALTAVVRR